MDTPAAQHGGSRGGEVLVDTITVDVVAAVDASRGNR
jgi:hypothetical protein